MTAPDPARPSVEIGFFVVSLVILVAGMAVPSHVGRVMEYAGAGLAIFFFGVIYGKIRVD